MHFVTAFAYINGKLYFGNNHLEVMTRAKADGAVSLHQLPVPGEPIRSSDPMAFGYIIDQGSHLEAEFYSDFFQPDQETNIFDEVFKKLQKVYPKLTTLSFGPDEETYKDMMKAFDEDENGGHVVTFSYTKKGKLNIING